MCTQVARSAHPVARPAPRRPRQRCLGPGRAETRASPCLAARRGSSQRCVLTTSANPHFKEEHPWIRLADRRRKPGLARRRRWTARFTPRRPLRSKFSHNVPDIFLPARCPSLQSLTPRHRSRSARREPPALLNRPRSLHPPPRRKVATSAIRDVFHRQGARESPSSAPNALDTRHRFSTFFALCSFPREARASAHSQPQPRSAHLSDAA